MAESDNRPSKRKMSILQPAFKKLKFSQPDAFVVVKPTTSTPKVKTPLVVQTAPRDAVIVANPSNHSNPVRIPKDVHRLSTSNPQIQARTKETPSLVMLSPAKVAKQHGDISEKPISVQTPHRNKLDKDLCDDLFSLKQWFSSKVKDVPVKYLTKKECQCVKEAIDSRLVENVSLALVLCKELAKTHLVSLLESYGDFFDDVCDTWREKLDSHLLDLPSSLADYFLAKEPERYKDLMNRVRDMPSIMVSMCLGAMLQNIEGLTKDTVRDIMVRLTIIGSLLFGSPSESTSEEKEEFDVTAQTSDESVMLDEEEDESDMSDDQDQISMTDESDIENSLEKNKGQKVHVSSQQIQSFEEQERPKSKLAEPMNEKSVEDRKTDDPREQLLEEFQDNYYIDYRDEIPFEGFTSPPKKDFDNVPIDHDYIHIPSNEKKKVKEESESDNGVEVSCPFCMWEYSTSDSNTPTDKQEDTDSKTDINSDATCTDKIKKEGANKSAATGTDTNIKEGANNNTGPDTDINAKPDTNTKEATTKNPAATTTTIASVKEAAKDSETIVHANDYDKANKEFNKHIKSLHCDSTGKAYKETVHIFSCKGLWVDNVSAPELGQVFICPYCLNVETVRSAHYMHVMRHENQCYHLTCFPCQQEFSSYEELTKHYSKEHGASDIHVSSDQRTPKVVTAKGPVIKDCSDKPAEAHMSFDYLDLCLDMEERNPGTFPFVTKGYPVFMAISHAYKTLAPFDKNTPAKGQFHSCMFNCNAVFKTAEELYMHRVNEHAEDCISVYVTKHTKDVSQWLKYRLSPLIQTCEVCNISVLGVAKLEFHQLATHPRAKHARCEKCGKSFPSKKVMFLHECCRTCDTCGKSYATKRGLKRHQCEVLEREKNYKRVCVKCDAIFHQKKDYIFHCKHAHPIHKHKNEVKVCGRCNRRFVGLAADHWYNVHVAQGSCEANSMSELVSKTLKNQPQVRSCPRCGKRFFNFERHAAHVGNINCTNDPAFKKLKRLQCYKCQKLFSSIHGLEEHLTIRLCTKPMSSTRKIGPRFTSNFEKAQYIRNLRQGEKLMKKRPNEPRRCDRCGKVVADLRKHQTYVNCTGKVQVARRKPRKSVKKQYERRPCERCGIMLREDTLRRHVGLVNCTKDVDFVQDEDCVKRYQNIVCKKCHKAFSKRMYLRHHLAKVNCTNDPDFVADPNYPKFQQPLMVCPRCGKSIPKNKLGGHLKQVNCTDDPNFIPVETKKFPCDKCGWNFSSDSKRKDHQASVNCNNDPDFVKPPKKEKKFPCDKCGKLFTTPYYIKHHQESVNCDNDPSFVAKPHKPGKPPIAPKIARVKKTTYTPAKETTQTQKTMTPRKTTPVLMIDNADVENHVIMVEGVEFQCVDMNEIPVQDIDGDEATLFSDELPVDQHVEICTDE